jgi:NAD(P)-dependent dehydrogenase (short-subunit alcohol dehydrogenase family)
MPVVLVTGANRGLGFEFAKQYLADGWRVIATVREPSRAEALRALPGKAEIHPLDVTDFAAAAKLGKSLAHEPIDVLIANAGVSGPRAMPAQEVDAAAWGEVFRVNTMAPLAVAGAFLEALGHGGQRKAIAISSRLGSMAENNDGGMYVYRSSKAALNAVWRSFALDNPSLIATMLHPGWVRTDMGGPSAPVSPPESVAGMRKVIAGLGKPDSGRFFNYDGTPLPW